MFVVLSLKCGQFAPFIGSGNKHVQVSIISNVTRTGVNNMSVYILITTDRIWVLTEDTPLNGAGLGYGSLTVGNV